MFTWGHNKTANALLASRRRFLRAAAGTVGGAFSAVLLWPTSAWADEKFSTIDFPGATFTNANGVNRNRAP
jgi:hypothetical protein